MKRIILAVAAMAVLLGAAGCGGGNATPSPNSNPPTSSGGQAAGRSTSCTVVDATDDIAITFVGSYQQGACGDFTSGDWTHDGGSTSPFNMSGRWVAGPIQPSWVAACTGPPAPTSSDDAKRGITAVSIYDTVGQPADGSSISNMCDEMESDRLEFRTSATY